MLLFTNVIEAQWIRSVQGANNIHIQAAKQVEGDGFRLLTYLEGTIGVVSLTDDGFSRWAVGLLSEEGLLYISDLETTGTGETVVVGGLNDGSPVRKALVGKLDSDGRLEWATALGGASDRWFTAVDILPDGGIVAVGILRLDDDITGAWVAFFSQDGEVLFERILESNRGWAADVSTAANGEVLIAGVRTYIVNPWGDGSVERGFFIRLAADGTCLGGGRFEAPDMFDNTSTFLLTVGETADGRVVVGGSFGRANTSGGHPLVVEKTGSAPAIVTALASEGSPWPGMTVSAVDGGQGVLLGGWLRFGDPPGLQEGWVWTSSEDGAGGRNWRWIGPENMAAACAAGNGDFLIATSGSPPLLARVSSTLLIPECETFVSEEVDSWQLAEPRFVDYSPPAQPVVSTVLSVELRAEPADVSTSLVCGQEPTPVPGIPVLSQSTSLLFAFLLGVGGFLVYRRNSDP